MNAREPLEVLSRMPDCAPHGPPLLFIHGAYAAAWTWDEYFMPWFAGLGYECHALSLRGHGASWGRDYLDSFSLADYVADVVRVADTLRAPPVLIGHSMGGMVAQKYIERRRVPGVALVCSVPPQGLWSSAMGLAMNNPGLLLELDRLLGGGRAAPDALREALFVQDIEPERMARYYREMQPESHRAIWDMTLFDLPRPMQPLPPLMVMGAEHDALIPPGLVQLTARTYDVEPLVLPGLAHGLMLEPDWQRAAAPIAGWLCKLRY